MQPRVLTQHSQPAKKQSIKLTFQDLIFMHNESLVLRFNELGRARREQKEGGRGDFISLATFAIPGDSKEAFNALKLCSIPSYLENWQNIVENKQTRSILYSALQPENHKQFRPSDLCVWQESLVRHMERSIQEHITQGILHCMRSGEKPALLLGKRGKTDNANICEINKEYPLGKFGTHGFYPNVIDCVIEDETLGIPVAPSFYPDANDTAGICRFNAEMDTMVESFVPKLYEKLICVIREKIWNKQQPSSQLSGLFWAEGKKAYSGFQQYKEARPSKGIK